MRGQIVNKPCLHLKLITEEIDSIFLLIYFLKINALSAIF